MVREIRGNQSHCIGDDDCITDFHSVGATMSLKASRAFTMPCSQFGLSLVELMVAMVIALFLSAAIAVVFLTTKNSFNSQDQLAQLQDSERLAFSVLTSTVQSAGYYPNATTTNALISLPASGTTLVAGQGIAGTAGVGVSDTLTTRYASASGDGLMDCLGQTYATGTNTLITNIFSVSTNNELQCSIDGGVTNIPLVSNVSGFSVLYGTDTSGSGGATTNINQYLNATAVTAGAWWGKVKSVRITVTFINPYNATPISWVQTISLMGKS
jgi:type IV pilus assembly protein PilW